MITEFEHKRYGKVHAAIIDEKPYLNYKEVTTMFGIKNSRDLRPKLNGDYFKELKEEKDGKQIVIYYLSFDSLIKVFYNSKYKEAGDVLDWLYREVLLKLEKLKTYNIKELKKDVNFVKLLDEFDDLKVKNNVLETTIKLNQTKLKMFDDLMGTKNAVDIDKVLDVIKYRKIERSQFYKILRDKGILNSDNIPTQEYLDKMMFRVVETKVVVKGQTIIQRRTFVFKSGITFIERILKNYVWKRYTKRKRVIYC